MISRRRLSFAAAVTAALGAVAALLAAGCGGPRDESEAIGIALADHARYQRGNVTTDFILPAVGLGLDRVDYGWRLREGQPPEVTVLELEKAVGRLAFFSADGDTRRVEFEAALSGDPGRRKLRVGVHLNAQGAGLLRVGREWARQTLELPADRVLQGRNLLELRPRPTSRRRAPRGFGTLRLRRLVFHSAAGRPPRPDRPERIAVEAGPALATADAAVRMPTGSYVDLVAPIPRRGRFEARLGVERLAGEGRAPVIVYARLLETDGSEHRLWEASYDEAQSDSSNVRIELGRWAGELCRLRLGVAGAGNAVVEWRDARLRGQLSTTGSSGFSRIGRTPPPRSGRLGRPDILLVLLDSARADAFLPYGGSYPTPALQRLAAEGTLFRHALSPAPWTGQSMAAMFTGFYPDTLGYATWGSPIPGEAATLAELLSAAGYRTVLVTQHLAFKDPRELLRGFDEVQVAEDRSFAALPLPGDLFDGERPTLAVVHLMPPHTPYQPPPPFFERYSSWYRGGALAATDFLLRFSGERRPQELGPADLRFIRDRYQENVAFADSLLGSLLQLLEARGVYDEALVMVLSDHGEAFLEHGLFLHTVDLHWEFLRIPWVVKWPASVGGYATEVEDTVSLIDLVPSLVDGLDLAAGGAGFQGLSLLPLVFDGETVERSIYAVSRGTVDASSAPDPRIMLRSGAWKIIYDPLRASAKVYKLESDPHERRNLAEELPGRTKLLIDAVLTQKHVNRLLLQAAAPLHQPEDLDEETLEQLRALGYVR